MGRIKVNGVEDWGLLAVAAAAAALGCYFPRGRIGLKGISVSLARQMLEGNAAAAAAAARAGDEMGP